MTHPTAAPLRSEIAQKMSLEFVRYSQVWEDAALLTQGLEIGPEDDVLSIMSSGDNALALLLAGARSVLAIDMSPAQVALFELKLEAIKALDHAEFVAFWGLRPHHDRQALYKDQLATKLNDHARAFWDAHIDELNAGPVHCGKLERYIQSFARDHLSELWEPDLIEVLFDPLLARDLEQQQEVLHRRALTPALEARFRWYFGREMMQKNGRDPQQFAYVEGGDVGLYFYKRFMWVTLNLPIRGNFYLESFLRAGFDDLSLAPDYLTPQGFAQLKTPGTLDRLSWTTDELEKILHTHSQRFNKANLSDIFEYMSPEAAQATFTQLAHAMRPQGRIAYWNLLVPRFPQGDTLNVLERKLATSQALHAQDRSWFYRDFWIDEIR